jgi:hypothetical protein
MSTYCGADIDGKSSHHCYPSGISERAIIIVIRIIHAIIWENLAVSGLAPHSISLQEVSFFSKIG